MVRDADLLEDRLKTEFAEPAAVTAERRHARRLFDKIMIAFHQACDLSDIEVSEHLLTLLELMSTRRPRPEDGNRRRSMENLVAAHERLWRLRNPKPE